MGVMLITMMILQSLDIIMSSNILKKNQSKISCVLLYKCHSISHQNHTKKSPRHTLLIQR